jgi:MFS family permease
VNVKASINLRKDTQVMNESLRSQKTSPLINRNFALLWVAQSISVIGDFAFDTTLVLWIVSTLAYKQPWAPIATSASSAMVLLPTLFIGPLAGVFVDRWDKRRTMLRMDLLRAILITILLLCSGIVQLPFFKGIQLNYIQLVALMVTVFLATVCTQFFGPSRTALIADIVPDAQRGQASGLFQITMSLAMVLGPMVATPVFVAFGVQVALLFNTISFLISFAVLLAIKVPALPVSQTETQHVIRKLRFWSEFQEGIAFAAKSKILMTIIITVILSSLGSGSIDTLLVFFLTENLHAPTALYYWLTTGFGVGAIIGALLSSIIIRRLGVARLYWSAILVSSLFIIAFAHATNLLAGTLLLFAVGATATALNVAIMPLIMHITPRELLGRVVGLFMPIQSAASIISITLSGALASTVLLHFHASLGPITFGRIDTIFSVTGILAFAAGIYALISLRNLNVELSAPAPEILAEETVAAEGIVGK